LLLWSLIDKRKGKGIDVDYLQVFELSIGSNDGVAIQEVVHRQECSPANKDYGNSFDIKRNANTTLRFWKGVEKYYF